MIYNLKAELSADKTLRITDALPQSVGENLTTKLVVTVPAKIAQYDYYIEFLCPSGKKFLSPKCKVERNEDGGYEFSHLLGNILLEQEGTVQVQLSARRIDDETVVWKSKLTKNCAFFVNSSVVASYKEFCYNDFFSQASQVSDKLLSLQDTFQEIWDNADSVLKDVEDRLAEPIWQGEPGAPGIDGKDGAQGRDGIDGADAPLTVWQYSEDGAVWHDTATIQDLYQRQSANNGTTWSHPLKYAYNGINAQVATEGAYSVLVNDNGRVAEKPIADFATNAHLDTKADKVDGKQLSSNDYTASDKSNVQLNTTARHVHDNKTILDATNAIYSQSKDGILNESLGEVLLDYRADNGLLTLTAVRSNGNRIVRTVDLPLELLVTSGYYDDIAEDIVLTLANNSAIRIPARALVNEYYADGVTIEQYNDQGKVTFAVKSKSITASHLSDIVLSRLSKADTALQPNAIADMATTSWVNQQGYMVGYSETDPTVPSWAKQTVKPQYTKGEIGLGNADNTSDANKPLSVAIQSALGSKAGVNSPVFSGNVKLPATTTVGSVTSMQLGYLAGATSNIQSQLNNKYSASNSPPYPVTSVNGKTGAVNITDSRWIDLGEFDDMYANLQAVVQYLFEQPRSQGPYYFLSAISDNKFAFQFAAYKTSDTTASALACYSGMGISAVELDISNPEIIVSMKDAIVAYTPQILNFDSVSGNKQYALSSVNGNQAMLTEVRSPVASASTVGGITMRIDGTTLYIRNDGGVA